MQAIVIVLLWFPSSALVPMLQAVKLQLITIGWHDFYIATKDRDPSVNKA